MDALGAVAGLQAMYQVHDNLAGGGVLNAPKAQIANQGDLGKDCAAHGVHCSVGSDAASYTVSVPSTGHSRRFVTTRK